MIKIIPLTEDMLEKLVSIFTLCFSTTHFVFMLIKRVYAYLILKAIDP